MDPVSPTLSQHRSFFLRRGNGTLGSDGWPTRLGQNAHIPPSRSPNASREAHFEASVPQGTPSSPFLKLLHYLCACAG